MKSWMKTVSRACLPHQDAPVPCSWLSVPSACLSEVLLFWLPCHLKPRTACCCMGVCSAGGCFPEQGSCNLHIALLLGAQSQSTVRQCGVQLSLISEVHWLPVVAFPVTLCGHVALSPSLPLWPTPKHGCVPCMVDGYFTCEKQNLSCLGILGS